MSGRAAPRPAGIGLRVFAAAVAVALAAFLFWRLRSLIVPVSAGALLAYICGPFLTRLEQWRFPRGAAVGLLLLLFGIMTLVAFHSVRAIVPDEMAALEMRVRALSALNERYRSLMGLDASWGGSNGLYRWTHRDLDPLMDRAREILALDPDDRLRLASPVEGGGEEHLARAQRLLDADSANARTHELHARRRGLAGSAAKTPGSWPEAPAAVTKSEPATLGHVLSPWLVTPLVFLFLLWDRGTIRRGLLRAVPNRLFEPALAVVADVDEALGNYVRGIFLECCALGLTVVAFLAIVGVPMRWAVVIGLFAGASNLVPYMGFVAALSAGLAYALLAANVHPLIPLVTVETFPFWVVAAVVCAELLKVVVYEPVVLGGAVRLHPLVIVLGVTGGAMLFGAAGMLLAVPTLTVIRVLVRSGARQVKAYGLV